MALEDPVISELYWTPNWFHATQIGKSGQSDGSCIIEENAIVLLLSVFEHENFIEIKFLCDSRACQLLLMKETFLERFNTLFKPINSLPKTV